MKKKIVSEPKILIIVPTLNSFRILNKLINSLLKQSYRNWEVIFVDGPSSSDHKEYLRSISNTDKRFHVFEQPISSKGIFAAMNYGLENKLETEWVLFWGSDDYAYDSNTFKSISKIIKDLYLEFGNIDLITFQGLYVDVNNFKEKRISKFINKNKYIKNNQFRQNLFLGNCPSHQATLFNRKLFTKYINYDESFKLSADLNFFLDLIKKKDLCVYNQNQYIVCMGDDGVSGRNFKKRILEVIKAYKNRFGNNWFIPFFLRYLKKFISRYSKFFSFELQNILNFKK